MLDMGTRGRRGRSTSTLLPKLTGRFAGSRHGQAHRIVENASFVDG